MPCNRLGLQGKLVGGGGNRTHVRKPLALRHYVCVPRIDLGDVVFHGRNTKSPVLAVSRSPRPGTWEASPHYDGLDPNPRTEARKTVLKTGFYAARASSTLSLAFFGFAPDFYEPRNQLDTRRKASMPSSKPVAPGCWVLRFQSTGRDGPVH
jgi:hypothetical protein